MGFPEWGTAPIKCAKRGCGWRGFETELDAEDGRQDMTTQCICPECGCHDYFFMTAKEVAKWEGWQAAMRKTQPAAQAQPEAKAKEES